MNRWHKVWRLIPLIAVLVFVLTGCGKENLSTLIPKGPVAAEQLWLMKFSLFIMVGVVVIVFAIAAYVLIRFRKRPDQTGYPVQVVGNHKLELIWTIIPIVLLLILAVPTVTSTFKLAQDYSNDKNAIQIKVTGHQFWWEFEYTDLKIHTAQDLYIPVGKKVQFQLTSADVNHSFWVPALGGKMDNNPGIINKMYLQADEPGIYSGKCAELCGSSHALMDFKVHAVSQAEFDSWVAGLKAEATVPADAAAGQTLFTSKCLQCHAVDSSKPGAYPNLDGFANRDKIAGFKPHTDEWLAKWLHDPQAVKPGTKMPNLHLNDDDINNLVKYLDTLK